MHRAIKKGREPGAGKKGKRRRDDKPTYHKTYARNAAQLKRDVHDRSPEKGQKEKHYSPAFRERLHGVAAKKISVDKSPRGPGLLSSLAKQSRWTKEKIERTKRETKEDPADTAKKRKNSQKICFDVSVISYRLLGGGQDDKKTCPAPNVGKGGMKKNRSASSSPRRTCYPG